MICLLLLKFTLRTGEPGATGGQHMEPESNTNMENGKGEGWLETKSR